MTKMSVCHATEMSSGMVLSSGMSMAMGVSKGIRSKENIDYKIRGA